MKRTLVMASVMAALVLAAACDGGDEDDDTSPSPSPTAANPDYCVLEWQGDRGDGTVNVYRLTMDADRWNGPQDYSDATGVFAIAAYRVPLNASSLFEAKLLTSPSNGGFSVTSSGVEQGNTLAFSDTRRQPVFVLTTALARDAVAGSAAVGTFTGVWSEFAVDPNEATFGAGQMTIVGTNFQTHTIPATGNHFGICFHATTLQRAATQFPLR